jgi:hypothetical protein
MDSGRKDSHRFVSVGRMVATDFKAALGVGRLHSLDQEPARLPRVFSHHDVARRRRE